ncbi:MAG: ATP-binding protein, partial [Bacteroidota bacterium]
MNLSLRARLTLWFCLVMAISLAVFSVLTYGSVSNELTSNLDVSLKNVISSLDVIIRKRAEQTKEAGEKPAPPPPAPHKKGSKSNDLAFLSKDSLAADSTIKTAIKPLKTELAAQRQDQKVDAVWTAIYEHIILNPRNFMIQVMDTNGTIVYRSDNLGKDSLHLPGSFITTAQDSTVQFISVDQPIRGKEGTQRLRIALARSRSAYIVAGYQVDEVQSLLDQFFSTLILLAPAVLLLSMVGGWFLAKTTLHPVDEITRTAQDITASNLSRRLPIPKSNDEIGRLSETLNDMISRLESSFERIRQFTADASHELRTPLTILTGELELALRTRKSPEDYQDVLSSALQEVLRLSHVVESLLLLSRTDMGQISLIKEPTDLTETLEEVADAATILGTQKNIYISFRHSQALFIEADRAKLYQMFLNLVDNAIKYTPEGGMITVGSKAREHEVVFFVRDTGEGVDPKQQDLIFEKFRQAESRKHGLKSDRGLGLAFCKMAVDAHGGRIWIESAPDIGSTFFVALPIAQEDGSGAARLESPS